MIINKRHAEILELLNTNRQVSVSELSKRFSISEVTIRKDLDHLEQNGYLIRVSGGAILKEQGNTDSSSCFIPPEVMKDYEDKRKIGILASNLINDEDFLFLGPGYTCVEIAKNLKDKKRLAIITMNISAAIELADIPENKLITVPGDFTKRNGTYYVSGPALFDYFSNNFFDKILITMDGISLARGFSVLDDTTAKIYQSLLKRSEEIIVCATGSKFDKNALAYLGPLTLADKIVTNEPVPEEYEKYFQENGIEVYYSQEQFNI
jgi:DeoR/GlpR family transcriptional regulator of sugar metabolism